MSTERNVKEIKRWMFDRDIKERDIVNSTGANQTYVNKTINGTRNNRDVLAYLREHGCPVRFLDLPNDMKEAA